MERTHCIQHLGECMVVLLLGFATILGQKTIISDPVPTLNKCQVDEKVPCGALDISPSSCEAISCCFDGQQCYYGNAVTVQCTRDGQFVVVVARDSTVPQIDLASIFLLEGKGAPCSPVAITDAFAIYNFPVTACGTISKAEGDHVVYENVISSSYEVGIGALGSITRDSIFELYIQCRYLAHDILGLLAEVYTVAPPPPVAAPGPLRVELRLANGQCYVKGCNEEVSAYTSYYQDGDYPVTKVLQQPVYVEVRILERTDPNIVLLLENCWATATPDPRGAPQWNLIVDGCPYEDDKYLTTFVPVDASSGLPFPTHYKRFILKMFTFVDPASLHHLEEKVFIHCSTAVCHLAASGSCEQRCSWKGRGISAVPAGSPGEAVVSSREVTLVPPTPGFRYEAPSRKH